MGTNLTPYNGMSWNGGTFRQDFDGAWLWFDKDGNAWNNFVDSHGNVLTQAERLELMNRDKSQTSVKQQLSDPSLDGSDTLLPKDGNLQRPDFSGTPNQYVGSYDSNSAKGSLGSGQVIDTRGRGDRGDSSSTTDSTSPIVDSSGSTVDSTSRPDFADTTQNRGDRNDQANLDLPSGSITNDGTLIDSAAVQKGLNEIESALITGDLSSACNGIAKMLQSLQQSLMKGLEGLNSDEATSLAAQISSLSSSILMSLYNNMYNRQNWILENDYNSPKRQVERLMEAGINPAFYFGAMGSSNAGQIASSNMQAGEMSYQGQSQLSDNQQKAIQGISAGTQLASAVLSGVALPSQIAVNRASAVMMGEQAKSIMAMRPAQVAQLWSGVAADFASAANNYAGANNNNANALLNSLKANAQHMANEVYSANMPALKEQVQKQNENIDSDTLKNLAESYKLANDVELGWNHFALGIYQVQKQFEISEKQIALGYYQTDMSNFSNLVNNYVDEIEVEEYLETDNTTGKTTNLGGSLEGKIGNDIIGSVKASLSGGVGTSTTIGNKTYSKQKSIKKVYDPDKMGLIIGGYLKMYQQARAGKLDMSPQQVANVNKNMSHIMEHWTNNSDSMQANKFGGYVGSSFLDMFNQNSSQFMP